MRPRVHWRPSSPPSLGVLAMFARACSLVAVVVGLVLSHDVATGQALQPGVRGLATRAPAEMKIDGDLSEFKVAFCTPVNYFVAANQLKDRPAQFFYMWDDTAFYAALR